MNTPGSVLQTRVQHIFADPCTHVCKVRVELRTKFNKIIGELSEEEVVSLHYSGTFGTFAAKVRAWLECIGPSSSDQIVLEGVQMDTKNWRQTTQGLEWEERSRGESRAGNVLSQQLKPVYSFPEPCFLICDMEWLWWHSNWHWAKDPLNLPL